MSREGVTVKLDTDSLYISTISLIHGFHWSLIHVDHRGMATRHHWAAVTIDPHGPEDYVDQPMPHGPRMKAGQQQILAYFKLTDYVPIDVSVLRKLCASIFPSSYPSALQNRAANMNSRTWVTHVLGTLAASSGRKAPCPMDTHILDTDIMHTADIEDFVLAHSRVYSDAYACAFLFSQPYETVVIPIMPCQEACVTCKPHVRVH